MKCDKVLDRLGAYSDGELSRLQSRRIGRHLEGCSSCQFHLAGLREVNRILGEIPMQPVPEGFALRVVAEAARRAPGVVRLSLIDHVSEWLTQAFQSMSYPVRLAACGTVIAASLGGVLMAERISLADRRYAVVVAARELDGLEWFGAVPPVSVGAAYLAAASTSSQVEGDAR
jgi:anti-sigma factor RsiW